MKRFDIVCGGLQLWVERWLAEWVRRAVQVTGLKQVALAGGIFMNVKANQAIAELPEVQRLFVFPCAATKPTPWRGLRRLSRSRPADAPPIPPLGPIYWGPEAEDTEIRRALEAEAAAFTWSRPADLAGARGGVPGGAAKSSLRFAGRAEFGARALGKPLDPGQPLQARGDPGDQRHDQERDFWMPFACSVLARRESDYLRNPKSLAAPYMILTFGTTERADEIAAGFTLTTGLSPAGGGPESNPEYHRLIEAFEAQTRDRGAPSIPRSISTATPSSTPPRRHWT